MGIEDFGIEEDTLLTVSEAPKKKAKASKSGKKEMFEKKMLYKIEAKDEEPVFLENLIQVLRHGDRRLWN